MPPSPPIWQGWGMVNNSWQDTTLGEFVRLQRGHDLPEEARQAGVVPIMGSAGRNGFHSTARARGPGVVIGRSGVGSMGVVSYCTTDFWPHNTVLYVTDFLGNDERFTYYLLRHLNLRRFDSGSVQASLNRNYIYPIRIRVPEPNEQRAIAHILGTLDDKIELNRRMNETMEAMARAIFKSWFVDFDPVRVKAEGHDPGLPKHIADLFPDRFEDSELGEIPAGWKISKIPQEIDFLEGPGLRNWQYCDSGMKFLNIRCISDGDLDVGKANAISLEEFEKTYRHFALCKDDIVISTSGTLGRLAIVRSDHLPVMLNTSIIRMRGRSPVSLAYVWGFLQSEYFLEEMFALAAGSVQLNFGPMHLKKISLLRPPDTVLSCFEDKTQPMIRKTIAIRKESRTLAALRDALLPKLISGEIRLWTGLPAERSAR
jgi:type I restriction enzyme, S subunit